MSRRVTLQSLLSRTVLVVIVAGSLSSVALAQPNDQSEPDQPLSWYNKLTTDQGVQEQFQENPILFFAAIFVLGIAVSLTPCVWPMIPITVSIVSGSKQAVPGRSAARHALAGLLSSAIYVLGVSITYASLGLAVASLRRGFMVRSLLQRWPVQTVIGALFVILGLSMVGLISLPIPGWGRGALAKVTQRQQSKRSLPVVFVLGLVSGIIASPCVAPVIAALLVWVSTAGPWLGWWALFVFGWGMGLLLIIVGMTGWVLSSGKWTLVVKTILGLLLLFMGVLVVVQGIRGQSLVPYTWLPK